MRLGKNFARGLVILILNNYCNIYLECAVTLQQQQPPAQPQQHVHQMAAAPTIVNSPVYMSSPVHTKIDSPRKPLFSC